MCSQKIGQLYKYEINETSNSKKYQVLENILHKSSQMYTHWAFLLFRKIEGKDKQLKSEKVKVRSHIGTLNSTKNLFYTKNK